MSLLDLAMYGLMVPLAIGWLVSVTAAWELLTKHRPEGRAVSDYVNGASWFGPDAFAPSGAAARRRMHLGLVVFFAIGFGVAAVAIATEVLPG